MGGVKMSELLGCTDRNDNFYRLRFSQVAMRFLKILQFCQILSRILHKPEFGIIF